MRDSDRQVRFEQASEELHEKAWLFAAEDVKVDKFLLTCAAEDELVAAEVELSGFVDEDSLFSFEMWDEQMCIALDSAPIWFVGVAFPFTFNKTDSFMAVVAMDSITTTYTKIRMAGRPVKKPVGWASLQPFEVLDAMLVVLRRHVTPQG